MANYFVNVNPQANGDHEVHKEGCSHMPLPKNQKPLGDFSSCHGAVRKAQLWDSNADGCYWCSRECHNS